MTSDDRVRTDPIDEAEQQYIVTEHSEGIAAGDRPAEPPRDEDRRDDDRGRRDEAAGEHRDQKSSSGGSMSMMTLLAAAGLALLFGFIGAWLYGALLGGSDEAKSGDQASQKNGDESESGDASGPGSSADRTAAAGRDLPAGERPGAYGVARNGGGSDRVDQLADQVDQLRTMIEERPRPASADDIEQLRGDLDAVHETIKGLQELPDRVQAIASSVDAVNAKLRGHVERFDEVADRTDAMESDLTAVRDKVEAATGDLGGGLLGGSEAGDGLGGPRSSLGTDRGATADTASMRRAVGPDAEDDSAIDRGLSELRAGEFDAARATFTELLEADPGDARVWYLAAVATGKATGEWKGEAERLVRQGLALERDGETPTVAIDAAVGDLPDRLGGAWLDYYRNRAGLR